jgi:hypothetical protein
LLHFHEERNHQGKENRILFPFQTKARGKEGAVQCRQRQGGLLKYYEREAAQKSLSADSFDNIAALGSPQTATLSVLPQLGSDWPQIH